MGYIVPIERARAKMAERGQRFIGDPEDKKSIQRIAERKAKKKRAKAERKRRAERRKIPKQYHLYIASPAWNRKRQQALRHHGNACRICRKTFDLQVHHKHYRTLGRESMKDLDVLCRDCHANHHEGDKPCCQDSFTQEFLSIIR